MGPANAFASLLGEAVVISGTEMLIRMTAAQADWEDALAEAIRDDPAVAGIQVRWRRSARGGRPWGKPQMLDSTVRATTQRARKPAGAVQADDAVAQIRVEGPFGSHPEGLLTRLMHEVARLYGQDLHPQKSDTKLEPRRWRMVLDHLGRPTGRLDLRLLSVREVDILKGQLGRAR